MFMDEFGTSYAYTSLGLALFVLGYGVGPLLFSPLSEIPRIGRNWPYILTFTAFVLITIPTALVHNAPAFMFFRFLQAFVGSPILATGGASIADVYDAAWTPIVLSTWGAACFVAPVAGTIISAAAPTHLGWRFSVCETLIASVTVLAMMLFLRETSADTVLFYRARRLRRATSNPDIRSQSELAQHGMNVKTIVVDSLLMPSKITLLDPAVLFINIYLCLIYGCYYSFFESFPIVYHGMYGSWIPACPCCEDGFFDPPQILWWGEEDELEAVGGNVCHGLYDESEELLLEILVLLRGERKVMIDGQCLVIYVSCIMTHKR